MHNNNTLHQLTLPLNETMSGHVIGQRNNGDLLVDPGGSAANIVEVKQDQITTVEDL